MLDSVQKVASPPHRGLARESVTLLVDGVEQVLEVVRQPRHLGGMQAFWLCPQCGTRRHHLYIVDGLVLGRCCHRRLDYRSRHVPRAVAKAAKLRRALNAPPGLLSPLPPRPRHNMQAAHYDRLAHKLAAVEDVIAGMLSATVRAVKRRKGGAMVDDDRGDVMLKERLSGTSTWAIAKRHKCSTAEVDAMIDRRLDYELSNAMRLKAVKLDITRIEALMQPFFEKAVKDKDCASGVLCCKLLERRALLLGLDQPTQSRRSGEFPPHQTDEVFSTHR